MTNLMTHTFDWLDYWKENVWPSSASNPVVKHGLKDVGVTAVDFLRLHGPFTFPDRNYAIVRLDICIKTYRASNPDELLVSEKITVHLFFVEDDEGYRLSKVNVWPDLSRK